MKQAKDEGIINQGRYTDTPPVGREFFEKAVCFVLKKIDGNLDAFTYHFPAPASKER